MVILEFKSAFDDQSAFQARHDECLEASPKTLLPGSTINGFKTGGQESANEALWFCSQKLVWLTDGGLKLRTRLGLHGCLHRCAVLCHAARHGPGL